ncbi:MAG: hypothetical protein BWZ08_00926 [candidate division BRC1 bacterium ADurb.BinA292]|nr:MAG: hypothetical protein BWZ08_00926 [candidate division BRC1 bacterium ADurb.BinA292]
MTAAYFREPWSAHAEPLLATVRMRKVDTLMPMVGLTEILNICRRNMAEVWAGDVDAIVADFISLPVAWFERSGALVQRAWDLFRRHQIGTNDAFYCILAGDWGAEIWSQDGNFIDQALKSGINMHDLRAKAFS